MEVSHSLGDLSRVPGPFAAISDDEGRGAARVPAGGPQGGKGGAQSWRWQPQRLARFEGAEAGTAVSVVNVDDDLNVFCRPSDRELHARLSEMERLANADSGHLRRPPKKAITEWQVGEACFAYVEVAQRTSKWRRGQVRQIFRERMMAEVFLIDDGLLYCFANHLLCPIEGPSRRKRHPFLSVPPTVWQCRLQALQTTFHPWSEWAAELRRRLVDGPVCSIVVMKLSPSTFGVPTVLCRLTCPETFGGEEIGAHVLRSINASRQVVPGPARPLCTATESASYPALPPAPFGVTLPVEAPTVVLAGHQLKVYVQYRLEEVDVRRLARLHPEHADWFETAGRYYAVMSTNEVDALASAAPPVEFRARVGAPCLAQFWSVWYRAEVTKRVGADRCEVFFVDFGNTNVVAVNKLRAPLMPQMPVCCHHYLWRGVARDPKCLLRPDAFSEAVSNRLAELRLYMQRQITYSDDGPVMQLFTDEECSSPAANSLSSLLIRF